MEIALWFLAIAVVFALWLAIRSAVTVCVLRVEAGKIRVVSRRKIAPSIVSELGDVIRRPAVSHATIRIVRSGGRAEVRIRGSITDAQAQQVRNVVGSIPLAKLINRG